MAVEQRAMCRRCGAVILEGRIFHVIEVTPLRIRRETLHLCSDCAEALAGWLASPRADEAVMMLQPERT